MYESTLKLPFITAKCLILSSSVMTFFNLSVCFLFFLFFYSILSRRCVTVAFHLICAFNINTFVVALFTVHYQKRRRRPCELVSSQTLMSLLIRSVLRRFFCFKRFVTHSLMHKSFAFSYQAEGGLLLRILLFSLISFSMALINML